MSTITKRALAQSLKKIAGKKEINKITITDITDKCGLNRQTFYYHFKDIYDLLEWIYMNEVIEKIEKSKIDENWQQGFLYVFDYIIKNKRFIYNTYNSISKDAFVKFMYKQTDILFSNVIESKASGKNISEADKKFVSDFYKFAFVGLIQDWIVKRMKEEPKDIIDKLSIMLDGSFDTFIDNLSAVQW